MSDLTASIKLDNGTVITVTRSNNAAGETVLSIDHGKESSVARLKLNERAALVSLLSASGALG